MDIPENYQTVMPYLILENASGFLSFTQKVFGAKENHKTMRDENVIRHAEVMIGGSTIMFADSTPEYKPAPSNLFVFVENADETFEKAIREGATKVTEMGDQPYGRSGGVKDPCGNVWWITSPES
jgi:PhnB protein